MCIQSVLFCPEVSAQMLCLLPTTSDPCERRHHHPGTLVCASVIWSDGVALQSLGTRMSAETPLRAGLCASLPPGTLEDSVHLLN